MLESDWFTKILRCAIICMEMHPGRAWLTWVQLFQRSLQPTTAKEPKPTMLSVLLFISFIS